MNVTDRRKRLRTLLAGSECLSPASVYDPLSARVAQAVGFEIGLLTGAVVASTTLAAPDLLVHTATEFAEQIRRITRVSNLSLFADADNGYGNALNVMRTVQEFEHAGVAGLTLEDTAAPLAFGQHDTKLGLVSIEEAVGKLRAAVAARSDPALMICARTPSIKLEGIEGLLARARAYAATGVDAMHVTGGRIATLEHLRAVSDVFGKPLIVGTNPFSREELAAAGVRLWYQGHHEVGAVVLALRQTYTHLFGGGAPSALGPAIAPAAEMQRLLGEDEYQQRLRDYMR